MKLGKFVFQGDGVIFLTSLFYFLLLAVFPSSLMAAPGYTAVQTTTSGTNRSAFSVGYDQLGLSIGDVVVSVTTDYSKIGSIIVQGTNDGTVDSDPSAATVTVSLDFVIAHRGGAGEAPENTLAAFSQALAIGSGIEMDVRLSADSEIVVIHDATVDRTTDGSGNVDSMTLAQLKTLDAGSHFDAAYAGETIPALAEVFSQFDSQAPADAYMSIETKVENTTMYAGLVALIEQYDLFDRVFIEPSSDAVADTVRAIDARIHLVFWAPTSADIDAALGYPFYERIYSTTGQSGRTDDVHATGKAFFLRVDTVSDWNQIQGIPIDGIITDNPELLTTLINNQIPVTVAGVPYSGIEGSPISLASFFPVIWRFSLYH
jgi:glycerophosphoryl diester phosphodiesterase